MKRVNLEPLHPPLTYEETKAAVTDLVKYPSVIRTEADPPITNQTYGLISFRLLSEPFVTPRGKKVYGLVKLRGNSASRDSALMDSSRIIREVDSVDIINIAGVGTWVPITEDDAFCREKLDVKMHEEEVVLRDMAAIEKRKKDEVIQKDIQDRVERLRNEKDTNDDPTSLKFYCMKRVIEMNLREEVARKLKLIKEHEEKYEKILRELSKLEDENSEYTNQWLKMYNSERQSVGLMPYVFTEKDQMDYNNRLSNLKKVKT